jgi:hypothetical protein
MAFGIADPTGAPQTALTSMDASGNWNMNGILTVSGGVVQLGVSLAAISADANNVYYELPSGNGNYSWRDHGGGSVFGSISGAGLTVNTGVLTLQTGKITCDSSSLYFVLPSGNNQFVWTNSSNAIAMTLSQAGVMSLANSLAVHNNLTVDGTATATGGVICSGNTNGNNTLGPFGVAYGFTGIYNAVALQWLNNNLNVHIDGSFVWTINSASSDSRLKRNVAPSTTDALAALSAIDLKEFDLLDTLDRESVIRHYPLGVTAQQVADIIPEAVRAGPGDEALLSIDLLPLVAYLIGGVQQLSKRLEALEGAGHVSH